ncbi:bZIP transcription factor [Metarhizium album ARSEF 1941]|uniref:BZIP transcription factor n=1 Tax=Metarhizium album (strain ARSEF 1941) TaxID=1081103 RepID=A0A0B2WZ95_METAS|nr:bZIP transcription factor [Metarhizium album ARSEF 1941]KHN99348.1 bZIP transcription factor [Metarhizium album ARSEF 1941]
MSTLTSNASDAASKTAKPSGLNSAQLERKRANDRESQRAIRARTKEHIARLEHEVRRLQSRDLSRECQHLLRCNEALEAELRRFRASVAVGCDGSGGGGPACPPPPPPPRTMPDMSFPNGHSIIARLPYDGRCDLAGEVGESSTTPRVPGRHGGQRGQHQHQSSSSSSLAWCLDVPRSAAWTPTSTPTGCARASPVAAPASCYVPAGHGRAAEDVLGPVPTAAADVGGLEAAGHTGRNAYLRRRDVLADGGRPGHDEYAGAPFALTAESLYLAGYGH